MKTIISAFLLIAAAAVCDAETILLSQQECRKMALSHNEEMKIASNNVAQAELDHKIARNSRLPQLSGSAMGMYVFPETDMGGMSLSMKGTWTAGLSLTQPVYVGGKILSGIRLAKLGVEATKLQQRSVRADVIADADNAYWTYIAVLEKQRMLDSMLEYINSIYTQVKNSMDVEMAISADLLRVEAKRSDFNYQLEKVKNGVEMCRISLCNIIGVDFSTEITPSDTVVSLPVDRDISFGYDMVANRPEYALLQKQIDVNREQIKLIRADYLPSLALSVGYMYYGNLKLKGYADTGGGLMVPFTQNLKDGFASIMLSLSVPIWNWGEGHKKIKKQKLAVENARLDFEKNTRLMSIELRNACNNLRSSSMLVSTAEAGERDAAEALRVVTDRFEVGMCTLTDLLEAQSQWHSARSNVIEAKTQYKIYETDYLHAAGLLD